MDLKYSRIWSDLICHCLQKLLSYAQHDKTHCLTEELRIRSSELFNLIRKLSIENSEDAPSYKKDNETDTDNLPTETTRRTSWPHPSNREAPRRQEHFPLDTQAIWYRDHTLQCTARVQTHHPSITASRYGQWTLMKTTYSFISSRMIFRTALMTLHFLTNQTTRRVWKLSWAKANHGLAYARFIALGTGSTWSAPLYKLYFDSFLFTCTSFVLRA